MSSLRPVIILTGASRGLGLAVLRLLLSTHGARVATLSRSYPAELKAVSEEFGEDRVLVVQGDVGKPEDNEAVVRRTMDRWGRLDGLVMNAGSLDPVGKLADVPIAQLIPSVQINLLSALYLLQPALPHLRRKSADGQGGLGRVVMAKAGMNSLCRTLAAEEAEEGVITWSVRPGLVDTSMQEAIRTRGPGIMSDKDMVKFQNAFENGELLAPEVPGAVIAALAVAGPKELSGEYLNWADERLQNLS
ncbi:hypothetical protein EHS25_003095 [Saitozyma podzolica]|uniref:Uncharacterized protein n=1 Tax=Saitozyma podzolica TaxID=1890683 RepID=A0A427YD32_9TREE|nr:hypothetical protein EHS25_003095 [Saitozyma podzolica]